MLMKSTCLNAEDAKGNDCTDGGADGADGAGGVCGGVGGVCGGVGGAGGAGGGTSVGDGTGDAKQ